MANQNLFLGSGPQDPNLKNQPFDKSFTNHLTARFGRVYPVFLEEAVAGSHYRIKPTIGFDLMPTVFPLQSNVTCHLSFFRCSFRNLLRPYKDFVSRVGNHKMPYIKRPVGWHDTGSLAEYMGIPSYNARHTRGWTNVPIFDSEDPTIKRFSRCSLIPLFNDPLSDDHETTTIVGVKSYPFYRGDSLNSFFTQGSEDYKCQISDFARIPIPDDEKYFRFRIIQGAVPSKMPPVSVHMLVYGAKVDGVRQNHPVATSDYFLSADFTEYQLNTTEQDGTYHQVNDTVVNLVGKTAHLVTYQVNLNASFVTAYNEIINAGYNVRFVLAWRQSSDTANSMGLSLLPQNGSVMPTQSMSAFTNFMTYSNGHYTTVSGSNTFNFFGLQPEFLVRSQAAENISMPEGDPLSISASTGEVALPINALPFRMYEFIHNLYFRNTEVDPFIKNGRPTYNEYLTNDGEGADTTTPVDFFNSLYEVDMFTSCKKSPQMGTAPLVGITSLSDTQQAVFHLVDEQNTPYTATVDMSSDGAITGISAYSGTGDTPQLERLNELINYGISINDFRSVSAFQRYLERNQRAGFDYRSVIKEFFGTNAPVGEEFPEYIGGVTRPVTLYKLENQTQGDYPIGFFAGSGRISVKPEEVENIDCFCSEPSYIMGLMWFSVTPVYSQSLPKHFTKSEFLDYYNPQFATIGAQPVFNYQLAPLQASSKENLMAVFGYNRPWVDYVSRQDEVHGQFRASQHDFVLQREFANIPELGKEFIEVEQDDLTNVFSYTLGTDKLFGAIHFDVKCNQPIPRFVMPSIVG